MTQDVTVVVRFPKITLEESRELQALQETLEDSSVQGSIRLTALFEAIQYCEAGKLSPENFVEINPSKQILLIKQSFEEEDCLNEENEQALAKITQKMNRVVEGVFEKKPLKKPDVLQKLLKTFKKPVDGAVRLSTLCEAVRYCQEGQLLVEKFIEINPAKQILLIKESFQKEGVLHKENEQKLIKISESVHEIVQRAFEQNSSCKKNSSRKNLSSWAFTLARWTTNAALCLFLIHKIAMLTGLFQELSLSDYNLLPVSSSDNPSTVESHDELPPSSNFTDIMPSSPFPPAGGNFSVSSLQCPAFQMIDDANVNRIISPLSLETIPPINERVPEVINEPFFHLTESFFSAPISPDAQYNITPVNPENNPSFSEATEGTFQGLIQSSLPSWHQVIPQINENVYTLGLILFRLALDRTSSKTSF